MQNSNSSHSGDIMMNFFDQRDLEVASIMLELCHPVVFESKPYKPTTLVSGTLKNRSIPTDPPPPLKPAGDAGIASASAEAAPPPSTHKVVVADSPVTPISFAPSESDQKCEDLKKRVSGTKIKRAESVTMRDMSSPQNEVLNKEIEILDRYYLELKTLNLQLKTMKLKLEKLATKEQLALPTVKPHPVDRQEHCPPQNLAAAHQQPLTALKMVSSSSAEKIMSFSHHCGVQTASFQTNCCGLGSKNTRDHERGPLEIDLNAPTPENFCQVEDLQPSDRSFVDNVWRTEPRSEKAIAAAEERRRAKEILRAKRASRALSRKPS